MDLERAVRQTLEAGSYDKKTTDTVRALLEVMRNSRQSSMETTATAEKKRNDWNGAFSECQSMFERLARRAPATGGETAAAAASAVRVETVKETAAAAASAVRVETVKETAAAAVPAGSVKTEKETAVAAVAAGSVETNTGKNKRKRAVTPPKAAEEEESVTIVIPLQLQRHLDAARKNAADATKEQSTMETLVLAATVEERVQLAIAVRDAAAEIVARVAAADKARYTALAQKLLRSGGTALLPRESTTVTSITKKLQQVYKKKVVAAAKKAGTEASPSFQKLALFKHDATEQVENCETMFWLAFL